MEDKVKRKKRKIKHESIESGKQITVWIREIIRFDRDGQATLSPSHGPYVLEINEPFETLFQAWERENDEIVPFKSWFYAKYPSNHPTPFSRPKKGQNEPQQLGRDQTPFSINLQDGAIIFARSLIILPRPNIEKQ
ncbi:uncharacterized protein IL334_004794 [Kwoniella shivajii]|uniref:Uncharacterized protein n=1 Tax=Kwoniella shivajii TaxID=564305 RepID=A0ABZ1D328_9TREE|nr:hypothetical protein IL334_004794 [Kwoniella shivajii]